MLAHVPRGKESNRSFSLSLFISIEHEQWTKKKKEASLPSLGCCSLICFCCFFLLFMIFLPVNVCNPFQWHRSIYAPCINLGISNKRSSAPLWMSFGKRCDLLVNSSFEEKEMLLLLFVFFFFYFTMSSLHMQKEAEREKWTFNCWFSTWISFHLFSH